MSLIAVGLDHHHAPLSLLERATVPEAEWTTVLRTLAGYANVHEVVFVSTCLRTEIIASVDLFHSAVDDFTDVLVNATGLTHEDLKDRLSVHFDRQAVSHVFEVAAGLQSIVPGEYEVLGQLRRAALLADDEHTTGPTLRLLFQRALASGRSVRNETALSRGTTSFAVAALDAARTHDAVALQGHVVVVGAGQLGSGIVKTLLASSPLPQTITVVNRTLSRAKDIAQGSELVQARGLSELRESIALADAVFFAVESPEVLWHEVRPDDAVPRVVVDLAMPRVVAAPIGERTTVIDLATLKDHIERALASRRDALSEAEALVASDVEAYLHEQRARGAAESVVAMRSHLDDIVASELERRRADFESLTPAQRASVESVVRAAVAKVAHRPTVVLKDTAGTERGARLVEAMRQLFGL